MYLTSTLQTVILHLVLLLQVHHSTCFMQLKMVWSCGFKLFWLWHHSPPTKEHLHCSPLYTDFSETFGMHWVFLFLFPFFFCCLLQPIKLILQHMVWETLEIPSFNSFFSPLNSSPNNRGPLPLLIAATAGRRGSLYPKEARQDLCYPERTRILAAAREF